RHTPCAVSSNGTRSVPTTFSLLLLLFLAPFLDEYIQTLERDRHILGLEPLEFDELLGVDERPGEVAGGLLAILRGGEVLCRYLFLLVRRQPGYGGEAERLDDLGVGLFCLHEVGGELADPLHALGESGRVVGRNGGSGEGEAEQNRKRRGQKSGHGQPSEW